jgi:hypothetical protein
VVYVSEAKAGRRFSGRITRQSGDAGFAVTDPGGEALPEEEFDVNTSLRGSLTKSGPHVAKRPTPSIDGHGNPRDNTSLQAPPSARPVRGMSLS